MESKLTKLFNKLFGLPTKEDRSKNSALIIPNYSKDDFYHALEKLEMEADSTVYRTVVKYSKDEDIFHVRIVKQVGQNYKLIGLSVTIDCENKCVRNEKDEKFLEW